MRRSLAALLVTVLCAAAASASHAAAYQPKPLPAKSTAPTARQDREAYIAFLTAHMSGAYRQFGLRDPACDEEAVRFLDGSARAIAEEPGAPTGKDLAAAGEALTTKGCRDPLVLLCYGRALHSIDHASTAAVQLRQTIKGFETVPYSHLLARIAPIQLVAILRQYPDISAPGERDRAVQLAIDWTAQAAGETSTADVPFFLTALQEDWEPCFRDRWLDVYDAVQRQPKVDPYLAAVVGGRAHIRQGWERRGSGWADTVTDTGWQGFEEHLEAARVLLTKAWKLRPDRPEAPTDMIRVAGGSSAAEEETRLWFDRAVAAQLDCRLAYFQYAWFLRPRWGGSHEAMYAFALECARTGRYDTDVPWRFLITLWEIYSDDDGNAWWWQRPTVYARVKEILTAYHQVQQREEARRDSQALLAACAWQAGEYGEARRVLDELGTQPFLDRFQEWFGVPAATAREQIHAFSGPLAAEALAAEKQAATDKGAAVTAYEALLPRLEDPLAAHYVRDRLAVLRLEQAFATGEWVDLIPSSDFLGWTVKSGEWKVEPDGALRAVLSDGPLLLCQADFGDHLELRGEVELPESTGGAAIYVSRSRFPVDRYITFRILSESPNVVLSYKLSATQRWEKTVALKKVNSFLLRLTGTTVAAYVNGELVYDGVDVDIVPPRLPRQVGFGTGYRGRHAFVLRHLQIRRLPGWTPTPGAGSPLSDEGG